MRNLFISALLVFLTPPTFAANCSDDLLGDFSIEITQQKPFGTARSVFDITTHAASLGGPHPGVALKSIFEDEPQVLFGIDSSRNNEGYLVVGQTLIRHKSYSTVSEGPQIATGLILFHMPVETEGNSITYKVLGFDKAERLPPGFFVRLKDLSAEQIRAFEKNVKRKVLPSALNRMGYTDQDLILNLLKSLAKTLDANLPKRNLFSRLTRLEREAAVRTVLEQGFVDSEGRPVDVDFYQIDNISMQKLARQPLNQEQKLVYGASAAFVAGIGAFALIEHLLGIPFP